MSSTMRLMSMWSTRRAITSRPRSAMALRFSTLLMAEGALPSQVWQDCGFQDYSGFYRAFTKIYGICPKDYIAIGTK